MKKTGHTQHYLTPEELGLRIVRHKAEIQLRWLSACKEFIPAAQLESFTYLQDSLPMVLDRLAEVLGKFDENHNFYEAMNLAKDHGKQRAASPQYTVRDLLVEYQLLREIIMDLASGQGVLSVRTANIVGSFIEASLAHSLNDFLLVSQKEISVTERALAPQSQLL